jgi:phosphotransferase system IIB component
MEASENPQHEIRLGDGAVRALDDRLVIEALTVTDRRAARVVRERAEANQPPAETLRKAIEIGTRVLDTEETAANVDYVRHELGELDRRLAGTLEEGAGELAERLATVFGADRNDSVQAQIKEIVSAESRQQREALIRMLTAEDGSNPLIAVQARLGKAMLDAEERHRKEVERLREANSKDARAMQAQVGDLRKELARLLERDAAEQRVAEAEEAGTRKGRTFEERVHAALDRIATARGDSAHRVGDEPGIGGSKKGDAVVELGAADGACAGRIVFEVKDEQLSKNKAWSELNAAMEERQADFAVLVTAGEESVPVGREQLTEYEGNKMIVAVDPEQPDELGLDLASRYARLRVMLKREGELTLDAAGVRDAAEEARSVLKNAQSIRLALTNADKSVSKARHGVDEMVDAVDGQLERIESLVASADEAD